MSRESRCHAGAESSSLVPARLNPTAEQNPAEVQLPVAVSQGELVSGDLPQGRPGEGLAKVKGELVKEGRVRPDPRPTFSQWDKEYLLSLVCCGVSVANATAAVGCSRRTFYRWLANDPVFRKRFHHDRARAEIDPLEMLREHAKHNWRAAEYLHRQSIRRERRLAKDKLEPSEKFLGQIEITLVNFLKDLRPLVQQLEGGLRESFDQVLAGHVDILCGVMNGLWRADEEEIVKRDPIRTELPIERG